MRNPKCSYLRVPAGKRNRMPKLLFILCGIIIGLVILREGIKLVELGVLLLPFYYSVRNLVHQIRTDGNWTLRWPKFWMAFSLELIVIGIPAYVIIMNEPHPSISVIFVLAVYIIVTAVAYGVAKKQNTLTN